MAFVNSIPLPSSHLSSSSFITPLPCVSSVKRVANKRCNVSPHASVPDEDSITNNDSSNIDRQITKSCKNDVPTSNPFSFDVNDISLTLCTLGFLFSALPAHAGDFFSPEVKEAFKTIPASLIHPAVMWGVTGTTLYTLWLGYQSSLIRSANVDKRKELVKAKVTERHFKTSSLLFATVSLSTFFGMANTFNRAGKLFPGPHLYTGLGIVALMSVMSSFVPYMQKGKNWARNSHFAAGIFVTGLFAWQATSGMQIVGKLTKWW